jgi:hypothetical protein
VIEILFIFMLICIIISMVILIIEVCMGVTIIEGPTPEFEYHDFGTVDVYGGTRIPLMVAKARVRTFDSGKLVDKILDDWESGDSPFEFPNMDYGKSYAKIIAVRRDDLPEGNSVILYLQA